MTLYSHEQGEFRETNFTIEKFTPMVFLIIVIIKHSLIFNRHGSTNHWMRFIKTQYIDHHMFL